jgi:secondary thiamine-phosphate synthase enzyme
MKSYRKELFFTTKNRYEFVHITPQIEEAVRESGVREGLCLVNAMHITASVFINDNESGLHRIIWNGSKKLAPFSERGYHHNVGEDNGDAHPEASDHGTGLTIAVTDGRLDLGPWEAIFYGEFDGRRRKRVLIKIIGE